MSQENVEVVRDALHAFAEGGLAAMAEFWATDINWRAIEGAPDDVGEIRGADALRRYFQDWIDTFDDVSNVPEELVDIGDSRVLAVQRAAGRAKASGIETELRYAVVYTVRNGKITRGREYIDRAAALEAVAPRRVEMSQGDPATTFRRAMEAYSRRDYDAAVVDFDPAIEWSVDVTVAPDATTYHGHAGVKQFWEMWEEAISGMELEIEECRSVAADRVLAITRAHGKGAGSGAPVASARFAQIADFRGGRVVRVRLYGGVAAALEAAGLRE